MQRNVQETIFVGWMLAYSMLIACLRFKMVVFEHVMHEIINAVLANEKVFVFPTVRLTVTYKQKRANDLFEQTYSYLRLCFYCVFEISPSFALLHQQTF